MLRVHGFGVRADGFGLRVKGLGFHRGLLLEDLSALAPWLQFSGLEYGVEGLGFGVWWLGFDFQVCREQGFPARSE